MPAKKFSHLKKKETKNYISQKITSILKILSMIDMGKKVTARSLAEEFECSEKTIYRYIKTIIEADFPIYFDKEAGSYVFQEDFSLKQFVLSPEDLSDFIVLKDLVNSLGLPADSAIKKIFDKITAAVKGAHDGKKSSIVIDLGEKPASPVIDKALSIINEAIKKRVKVRMKYFTLGRKKLTEREVSPYGLIFHEGFWYLIGKCSLHYEIRTFACDQIREIELTDERFGYPSDFSLQKFMSQSFGIITGEEPIDVAIRFSSTVAAQVLRKKWHSSQKEEKLPDGNVILRFQVSGIKEIKNWINSWLPHCEVLEPTELREDIKEELKQAAKLYK
ncbi:MAG: transcriptional regulator [Candidatus Schekmanbacteria bacterium]|nr:transcriptional regulator [Candidatus Schekmanbacteria bacterium]